MQDAPLLHLLQAVGLGKAVLMNKHPANPAPGTSTTLVVSVGSAYAALQGLLPSVKAQASAVSTAWLAQHSSSI